MSSNATTSKASKGKSKSVSRAARAGLQFPVGRIARFLKAGKYADRVGSGAPVYLAAVLEYLAAEVLELAGDQARESRKNRISPTHIQAAISDNEELKMLVGPHAIFPSSGVVPNIHENLLPKSTGEGHKTTGNNSQF